MTTDTHRSIEDRPDDWERERARRTERSNAVRRSEAVLRILKDRSTVVEEAVRMDVDVDTVVAWLAATSAAISRALACEPATGSRRAAIDPQTTQRHVLTV